MDKIEYKYGKEYIHDLSKEKLEFREIMTIFTFINRAERHAGRGWYEGCIENNTFYNLLCRLEEILYELKKPNHTSDNPIYNYTDEKQLIEENVETSSNGSNNLDNCLFLEEFKGVNETANNYNEFPREKPDIKSTENEYISKLGDKYNKYN